MNKEEFNKKLSDIEGSFVLSENKIKASKRNWKSLVGPLAKISDKFSKGKPLTGIEIEDLRSLWISDDPFIDENGNPFVLYINDFSKLSFFGYSLPKFHVCWCSTLDMMDRNGRRARYVGKTDLDNNNFKGTYSSERKGTEILSACYNCRNKMREIVAPQSLYYSRDELNIVKFFDLYGRQDLKESIGGLFSNNYPKDWNNISRKQKEKVNYVCQGCGKSFENARYMLDTHHIDGVPGNVNNDNLIVLCRDCHIKQFGHGHMKKK